MARFFTRLPGKIPAGLRVLILNPFSAILTIIARVSAGIMHGEWAVLYLIAAGTTMFWAYGMYYVGIEKGWGRKK